MGSFKNTFELEMLDHATGTGEARSTFTGEARSTFTSQE